MTLNRRHAIALALAATAVSLGAQQARPSRRLADEIGLPNLDELFPSSFAGWKVDRWSAVVLPSPDVQAKLNEFYNLTLSRTYVGEDGYRIMLSVAYGGDQSDSTKVHRPEVCYPGQGFSVRSSHVDGIEMGGHRLPVRRLLAVQGNRHEPVTYWIVVGREVALSGTEQKLAQMRYGLRGLVPDGILIRISSIDRTTDNAYAEQDRFVRDLAASVPSAEAWRIFGELGT